jgi:tRNA pseudouridine32 synthase/23S rRNA pseudouridine746 synthase
LTYFQNFKKNISEIPLPEKFTFPFYYEPHPLAKIAVKELQAYLENQTDFKHSFGLKNNSKELAIGKMFGILIVKNKQHKIGYLAAFSGKLADNSFPKKFVPPIFNMRTDGSFYVKGEEEINQLNAQLTIIKRDQTYVRLKKSLQEIIKNIEINLSLEKRKLNVKKVERKARKKIGKSTLRNSDYDSLNKKLIQESFNDQFYYKELQEYYEEKIDKKRAEVTVYEEKIASLIKQRKEKSNDLQQTLFSKYAFLNKDKKQKYLLDIFNNPTMKPPAGSGECSAPKLLQYAFLTNLTPICMAEFWWGVSPNSTIRKHKNFYPACQGRCKPILTHMLEGIEMEDNLLLKSLAKDQDLEIIYEDEVLLVINKPAEFLSVPGKDITDSVYTRIKKKYPNATGPLIVHRLDMSTSGILLVTKSKKANKNLQNQFIKRTIKKRYVAVLDGSLSENKGKIELPLRVDLEDRPRQLVDFEHGKSTETNWEVVKKENGKTRVYFYPVTGRTHQLRVHAAHKDGLNTPIFGDDLYGKKENRLHLHAEYIEFLHPTTNKTMRFSVAADF